MAGRALCRRRHKRLKFPALRTAHADKLLNIHGDSADRGERFIIFAQPSGVPVRPIHDEFGVCRRGFAVIDAAVITSC
jgi:hypothetical protein